MLFRLKSVKSSVTTVFSVFQLLILYKNLLWKAICESKCWYKKLSVSVGRIYYLLKINKINEIWNYLTDRYLSTGNDTVTKQVINKLLCFVRLILETSGVQFLSVSF